MSATTEHRRPWVDLLALVLAFFAAIVTFVGAILTYGSQAKIASGSLWPLPGWVLVDWLLISIIGFVATFFCLRRKSAGWRKMIWIFTGAYVPLIILGAFSIGSIVLIAFFLAVISTFITAIRQNSKWLEGFGFLMLGSIGNLAILALIIFSAGQV